MSLLEAILLGVVQGLTEFLPISSSGHLILVPWLQDYGFLQAHDDFNRTFDVALHAGTLVAVVVYFRAELGAVIAGLLRSIRSRSIDAPDERLGWALVVGTIPAVILGGAAGNVIDDHLAEPWLIGINLAVFGLLLWHADGRREEREVESFGIPDGIKVGIAQALALIPGTSRSGVTITAARYLGFRREAAARVSFLLLAPAVAGATAYSALKAVHEGFPDGVAGPMIVGTIAAALSGYLAIGWLLRLVQHASYRPFVVYRLAIALGVLILIATGVREATF